MIALISFFTRRNTVLVIQGGAVLLLISIMLTWVTASGLPGISASDVAGYTGGDLAPALAATGLVGVAAGFAASLAGKPLRTAIGAVLFGAGIIAGWQAIQVLRHPEAAFASAASRDDESSLAVTETAANYDTHLAIWMGLFGALLLTIGSLALLLISPAWPDRKVGKKYNRQASAGESENPDEIDMWDGLSDGEDPTDTSDGKGQS